MQRIHLASDHAGFDLKATLAQQLTGLGYEVVDDGTHSKESCDYPVFAHKLCEAVEREHCLGILVCGTGIGMSLAANRHPGIRAALCATELHARLSRRHNNANVLCLGSRVTGVELALAIMGAFLESQFEGGRHQRRLDQLNALA
ncbi:MAG: ribose 5-phosphate isomerase B [Desulfovibrio sp.]|uniref:ribose 5-phosphate isomerase B n=1 Tax=Desulfovibrio sp. TaxID=885 RepID=UPI002588E1AC|nr:ribose 5-phosphate isomerase B [Desulfovibrio sp.]MCD7984124.1 ribose 5-phosphate isomerase B [Desulfovibrio sp.]